MYIDLSGRWQIRLSDGSTYPAVLPGSLDENRIGSPDAPDLATRLTRVCTYEGPAVFSRTFSDAVPEGRLFLEVERARQLSLRIDGEAVLPLHPVTLSSASVFEVTGRLRTGSVIELTSDNSYPGWPHDNIVYSSAATDETQTNWNGLLGRLQLRSEPESYLESVRIYPYQNTTDRFSLKICIDLDLSEEGCASICVSSPVLEAPIQAEIHRPAGRSTYTVEAVVRADAALWDEYEGNLHSLQVQLKTGQMTTEKEVCFGLRSLGCNAEGRLTVNGRVIFIRSEANCCEFPETGHAPMTVPEWLDILATYKSYGINCMRFHSHCPPEAAFTAADQMGILMQPELSHWNPRTAFESPEAQAYYFTEAQAIVRELANHPSFCMLTFGNELWAGEAGHAQMHALLDLLHAQDPTRLYADGSNVHYGQIGCDGPSDFYASQKYFSMDLRGTFSNMQGFINQEYPSSVHTYNDTMDALRKTYAKPVISFEVGQFEVLPDFDEIGDFHGVRRPVNFEIVQERVQARGLLPRWKEYVEATGEMSLLGYRAEIEAVLRTPGMSGISLLGLQDFTGQGTALVGMLNSHLQPKPFAFARPERFRRFFTDVVPLALLPRYTMTAAETLSIPVVIANYGKQDLTEPLAWTWTREGETVAAGNLPPAVCAKGGLTNLEALSFRPAACGRYDLTLRIGSYENAYPVWVYPAAEVRVPAGVHTARTLDSEALQVLQAGGRVFLSPPAEKQYLPNAVRSQFTTDFWSVGTFKNQEGGMSLLIDAGHPALQDFPTETHSNWQWWAMSNGLGVIVPAGLRSIITLMDCYAYLRPMTCLFEARVGGGRLLFSSMGLLENTQYPEVRALLNSLYVYMDSDRFDPEQTVSVETIRGFFGNER